MNVKLISVTQALHPQDIGLDVSMSAEQLIVYIARVSNPSNQGNLETADKLIGYLIKNKHWSPFDMVNMTIEVTTSRAIAQQILRHWSIKPQEFSQRYAEAVDVEPISLRKAAASNRQSSEEEFDPEITFDNGKTMKASTAVNLSVKQSQGLYRHLIEAGVAKECARMILPLATSTTLYLNGSARSWIHYLQQRTDLHAQLEHRRVAQEIMKIFINQFPNISKALTWTK